MRAILLLAAFAAAQPQNGGGPRGGPPPPAYDACSGRTTAEPCSFSTPNGDMSGACYDFGGGRMACVPQGAPIPPGQRQIQAPPAPVQYQAPPPVQAPPQPPPAPTPPQPQPEPAKETQAPAPERRNILGPALGGLGVLLGLIAIWAARSRREPASPEFSATLPTKATVALPTLALPPAAAPTLQVPAGPRSGFTLGDAGAFGRRLIGGTYETRGELGAGGMGVVLDAMDLKLDRRVAIKQLRPEIAKGGRARERFLAEARMVAKLQHPNIIGIHAIVEEKDELFLVFEYVDGGTLDQLLDQKKKFAPAEAMKILLGVADAVDYAHSQKVIHRDLKPSNVMVDKQGRARVMDFGIAHQAKMTVSQFTTADAFGTQAYMPPEQALGQAVRESDVFAFAALTYETLTGELPFPGPDFHLQKVQMVYKRPSESLGIAAADVPFDRAFQPEAKKRFPTVGEFLRTLEVSLPKS